MQIGTFYTLILLTLMDELQPQVGGTNSDRSRWKLTEQTLIRVRINLVQHKICSNMTSMKQRQESLIRAKPGHRIHLEHEKLKMTFSCKPVHRRTILKNWENKCIVATKQHRGVHKDTCDQSRNANSLRDTRKIPRPLYSMESLLSTSRQEYLGYD